MKIGDRIHSPLTGTTYTIYHTFKAGGQAEVGFATSDRSDKPYFVKRLLTRYSDKSPMREACLAFENNRREIYRRINSYTLEGASCPFVCDFFREGSFYHVVTGMIDGFGLVVADVAKCLTLQEKLLLCKTIAYSFYPLERGNIIHGDIKPDNFIIKQKDEHFVVKMVDLESSFLAQDPPESDYLVGTEPYYSPELMDYSLEATAATADALSTKSDIFSLGIVFYEIFAGKSPAEGTGKYTFEVVKSHGSIPWPASFPEELVGLIKSMLDLNPDRRPDIMAVLRALKKIKTETLPVDKVVHSPYVSVTPTTSDHSLVHIYCLQRGAQVYYSLMGGSFVRYEEPFSIKEDDLELRVKVTMGNSSQEFTHKVSASVIRSGKVVRPKIEIAGGRVIMSTKTASAEIRYTTDGTHPTVISRKYSSPFSVPDGVLIRVKAFKKGMHSSEEVSISSGSKVKIS